MIRLPDGRFVGLTVNVGLNLYVIPRMGPNGAALATVVGEGVSMAILLIGVGSLFRGVPPGSPGEPSA